MSIAAKLIAGILLFFSVNLSTHAKSQLAELTAGSDYKSRVIILADMGNEPDEEQQMIHMLVSSNEFELEGLIAVTGKFLTHFVYPGLFHDLIDRYGMVLPNLKKHADGWHDTGYLHSIVAPGQSRYGMAHTGINRTSLGAGLIKKSLLKNDPRPLYVVVNAGSNTLAQALIELKHEYPGKIDKLVAKLRVFENGAQDDAGSWICANFPNIHWMRSNYQTYSFGGPYVNRQSAKLDIGPNHWKPYAYSFAGQHQWAIEHVIAEHGMLGARYPLRVIPRGSLRYLEGGGTIPWLAVVNRGLFDPNKPHWGGWGGRFTTEKVENVWSRHKDVKRLEQDYAPFKVFTETGDTWTDPESKETLVNDFRAGIWRWRQAMYNDFQARMDWNVAAFDQANHHPRAVVNGDTSDAILFADAGAGESLRFDASASQDPDNDKLKYNWFIYKDAGTYAKEIKLKRANKDSVIVTVPRDAAGKQLHLILEVYDQGRAPSLYDYRRVVIDVR